MKYLLLLLLLPALAHAQEPVWTKCVYEKEYHFAYGNKDHKEKDGIRYCQNKYAFGFFINGQSEVFEMAGYTQDTSGGYMTESFYNKAGNTSLEGDYFVTITHSSPAKIFIQHTKGNSGYYYILTKQIPMVKLARHE